MCEARESYALALGKSYAHYGRHRDIQALCRAIDAVSAPELQGIAAEVYDPEGLTTLVYH